jgi:outer membrane protein TolC
VTQPLYTGGGITAGREVARMDNDQASWAAARTALDLRFSARSYYWKAVAAAAAVEVAMAQKRRADRLLEDTRALRAAGMAVDADVYAGEARVAASQVDIIRAQTEKERTLAELRSLLALSPETEIVLADAGTDAVPPLPQALTELQAHALAGRPELKIADARIDGLGARARAVDATRMPSVALSGQWLLARPNQRFLPLEDVWNDSWRVGVAASWQLFDGHRTQAQAATVRAEQEAVRADRSELERQVKLQVETTRLELEAAIDAIGAADASRRSAAAWEESSKERYAAGLASISEMLDAQADLTSAEVAQVRTRVAAWLAAVALERAIGK